MEEVASSEQRPSNYGFVFPPPRSKQRDSPGIGGGSKLWNVVTSSTGLIYTKKKGQM